MGAGVGEDVDAMVQMDCAKLAARVAWQSRVTSRMDVAGMHRLARLEASRHPDFLALRFAFRERAWNGIRSERGSGLERVGADFPVSTSARLMSPLLARDERRR